MPDNEIYDAETGEVIENSGSLQEIDRKIAFAHTSFLNCDSCYLAQRGCPKYKAGSACTMSWDEIYQRFGSEEGLQLSVLDLLQAQYRRIKRAIAMEEASGGLLDKAVSEEYTRYFNSLKILKSLSMEEETLFIKKTGSRGKSSGGLMEKFLGQDKK